MALTRRGLLKLFGVAALSSQVVETEPNKVQKAIDLAESLKAPDIFNMDQDCSIKLNGNGGSDIISVKSGSLHLTPGSKPITIYAESDTVINGSIQLCKHASITLYPHKGKWEII